MRPTLGIMALLLSRKQGFEEWSYFKKLFLNGEKLGLDMILFTPDDVDHTRQRVNAYYYDTDRMRWARKRTPLPHLIYDRCRYQDSDRFARFKQFRARYNSQLGFLSRPLANKWTMHQVLSKNPEIRRHLPETTLFQKTSDLLNFLKRHDVVYLKPKNGTGGRGILRIERQNNGLFKIQGRDGSRKIIAPQIASAGQIAPRLSSWDLHGNYLIQQGIPLKLNDGRVHDYRLLVQKNGSGDWEVTGCAGRIGAGGSITSNLHGGGKAVEMTKLLKQLYSDDKIETIKDSVHQFGYTVVNYLEDQYGKMCEIGLDIAVDPEGNVWLLEVNPKPAREVFSRIGEKETYQKALTRPLEYALWVYRQKTK